LLHGYQERHPGGDWAAFTPFRSVPVLDWADPGLLRADLDGDGLTDLLLADGEVLRWHRSLGRDGHGPQQQALAGGDEERGPVLLDSDRTGAVLLADMSGDGLADLVRVRNGEVCYWPNLGHGRFGAKVAMSGGPVFDHAEQFDPGRLRLADIDGSGPTDLIYLGRGKVRYWVNQAGNGYGPAQTVVRSGSSAASAWSSRSTPSRSRANGELGCSPGRRPPSCTGHRCAAAPGSTPARSWPSRWSPASSGPSTTGVT
jgi:hypothetical protein